MKTFIQTTNLAFTYPAYSAAEVSTGALFNDLNYTVCEGEFHTIIGAPESGKTTLSRILSGLVPRYTGGDLEGTVEILGRDISDTRPQDLIETVGTIFQNPDDQILTTRVDSEIAYPLESLGFARHIIEERVDRELLRFELKDKADRNPASLSGGEKKRLLCAVLAAIAPPIWILDETLDEMDPHWRTILFEYLTEQNSTVILFSSKMPTPLPLTGPEPSVEPSVVPAAPAGGETPAQSTSAGSRQAAILSRGQLHTDEAEIEKIAEREGLRWKPSFTKDKSLGDRTNPPLLKAEGLSFSYEESADFSLQVDQIELFAGETVTLAGPNGCGKTTLAKILCGLYTPLSGGIQLPQVQQGNASPELLRSSAAYMFQNPDYQIFLPSIEEELAYGLKEEGRPHGEIRSLVQRAIDTFQLPSGDTSPTLLSYGTRKRLQAATYWLLQRPLCIFDETDSGISPKDFAALIRAFQSPRRTLLIISHDAELAQHYSDRLLHMKNGLLLPHTPAASTTQEPPASETQARGGRK